MIIKSSTSLQLESTQLNHSIMLITWLTQYNLIVEFFSDSNLFVEFCLVTDAYAHGESIEI